MILKELENIVLTENEKGSRENYIKNSLKEYLQVYLLFSDGWKDSRDIQKAFFERD